MWWTRTDLETPVRPGTVLDLDPGEVQVTDILREVAWEDVVRHKLLHIRVRRLFRSL